MTFDKVIDAFRDGKRIYRDYWRSELGYDSSYSMKYRSEGWYEIGDKYSEPRMYDNMKMINILATDWQVLDE
jgi:hypothetical protein